MGGSLLPRSFPARHAACCKENISLLEPVEQAMNGLTGPISSLLLFVARMNRFHRGERRCRFLLTRGSVPK